MTEKQIANYVHKNFKIKKTKKAPKKKPKVTRKKKLVQPKTPQLSIPAAKPSQLPLPLPLPNRNFPSSFPSIPSQLSQTTKQDIPEVTNLVNELRTYKQLDKKRQEENQKLENKARQLAIDAETQRLQTLEAERAAQIKIAKAEAETREKIRKAEQQFQRVNKKLAKQTEIFDQDRNLIISYLRDNITKMSGEIQRVINVKRQTETNIIKSELQKTYPGISLTNWATAQGLKGRKHNDIAKEIINERQDLRLALISTEELNEKLKEINNEENRIQREFDYLQKQYTTYTRKNEEDEEDEDEEDEDEGEEEEEDDGFDSLNPKPEEDGKRKPKQEGNGQQHETYQSLLAERARLLHYLENLKKGSGVSTDNGLWTNQINKVMQKLPQFLGTVASDQFPTLLNKIKPNSKIAWISNIEPSTKGGSHWVAFVINGTSTPPDAYSIMFFDPFGEDIPKNMLKDLKLIADKISPNVMLKLKISRIQHQDESTNNCGYFSVNFIIDILSRNKTFAQASGFTDRKEDQSGKYEKEIERLKDLPPFNYLDIVDQEGGFIVRSQAPPKVRNFLNKFGGEYIENIAVYRKPILSIIQKAIDWLRKIPGREANEQYDKLFHLYLVVTLKDSNRSFKVERNQVLNIEPATQSDLTGENVEAKAIQPPNMTFKEMFDKASGGRAEFFRYSAINNNCQMFVRDLLQAGGVWTNELSNFIMQDVKDLLPKFITDIADKVTDVAHTADIILEGNGRQKYGCNCGKSNRNFNRL